MSDVSRRAVLGAGAGIAGAVAFGVNESAAQAATTKVSNAIPARSKYKQSLGRIFTARRNGHSYRVKLTAIHNGSATDRQRSFILQFTPVGGSKPKDGIYVLSSKSVGAHNLFLSTVGTAHGLQAVIDRTH